jgi:hypothetical protein
VSDNVKPQVWARCPFCDGEYGLDEDVKLQMPDGSVRRFAAAIHSVPECVEFHAATDGLDFAVKARKAREAASKTRAATSN